MRLKSGERLKDYGAKGVHFALRRAGIAPEHVRARRLGAQATNLPPPADGAPRVVFLSPRDWAVHVQCEGMIGQALRLRGADVRIITCGGGLEICDRSTAWESPPMPCSSCTRYLDNAVDAHGFDRLVIRDGWTPDGDAWPELDALPAPALIQIERDGLRLGRLVDIPAKWFLMSTQLDTDPLGPTTLRRFVRSAQRVARGLTAALDKLRPDVVVMLNGLFMFEGICWALCRQRGIPVVTYERGLVKEMLVFRRDAPACWYEMPEAWAAWKDIPLTADEEAELDEYTADRELGNRTIDSFRQNARIERIQRPEGGRVATLFTNLTWDSAVIGRDVAFPSIQAWLAAAVEAFAERPGDRLIVRVHPAEAEPPDRQTREPILSFLHERFPVLPPNISVVGADDTTSSYGLMADTDFGMVYTTTVGLELALRGKPVIVAGQTHYRSKGFTVDVSNPVEFQSAIVRLLADPAACAPDRDLVRRYAYLLFLRVPLPSPGVEEHVRGLARITVKDLHELAPGRSATLDRLCDGILGRGDFVPAPATN